MTDLSKCFQEALAAARQSVQMKIFKKGGNLKEDFDPETLLYSLFEAEIPFQHIFLIFDNIIRRLGNLVKSDLTDITEDQLHGQVAKAISAHPDSEARVWLTNYHNAYALDSDTEKDDEDERFYLSDDPEQLIPARKASLIRGLIKEHLASQLSVTEEQVSELIRSPALPLLGEDVREATTRILKFIRFTGMVEARQSMLRLFIEELSLRSQKRFIHREFQDDEEREKEIEIAQRAYETARIQCDTDPFKARTEFQSALELLGRIFLTACQLASCPARQHSFQYLLGLLRTFDHTNRGDNIKEELPHLIIDRMNSALTPTGQHTAYQIRMLREAAETLAIMSETLADAASEGTTGETPATLSKALAFDKGASAFQTILYQARSLRGMVTGRKQIVDALRASSEQRARKVCDAAIEFIREELQLSCEEVSSSSGIVLRVRELAKLRTRADCLRHGRDTLLLFRFGYDKSEPLSLTHVQDFLFKVIADPTCFGIILSDQRRDSAFRKELNQICQSTRRVIIWMGTKTLTGLFHLREKFLETIDGTLKRDFQWLDESEDSEIIPTAITGYVREFLMVMNKLEAERNWNEIRAQIGPFLEEMASDYKHYFYQRVLPSIQSLPPDKKSDVENRLQKFMAGGMLGVAIDFANCCLSLPSHVVSPPLRICLEAFKEFIEKVKPHRNKLAHEHGRGFDVLQALNEMIKALDKLTQAAPYPNLYLCLPGSDNKLIATPLFGAAERSQTPPIAQVGLVLAIWNDTDLSQELVLPKMLKPSSDDQGAVSLIIDLDIQDIAGNAKGQGRILPVLLRTLRNTVTRFKEASKETEASTPQGALTPLSTWLLNVMADADANSIAAELVARLGGYDQELAIAAMEDALQYASRQSGVQVEITSHGHRLIMKCDSEERIGCSIFDQAGLRDVNRVRDEIEYWAKSQATGFSHHFAFLFADPTECEEEIRRLKQETLMLNAARELYALNHILEPEHTYFLLQCAGLEGGSAASEPGQGSGGKGGGAASGGLSGAYQPPESHFDVFISYNTEDQEEVREIVNRLREAGINPWFDVDELLAGDTWGRELEKAIEHIGSAAVFLGKGGLGPWHQEEMYAILNRFTSLGRRIIPVILSGGLDLVDLPLFLQNRQWVDFRVSSPDPLQRLINGITGKRPR